MSLSSGPGAQPAPLQVQERRRRLGRILLRVGAGAGALVLVGLLLVFLLIQATNNRQLYERYYALLYAAVNLTVAGTLALVILGYFYRLVRRLRSGASSAAGLLIKLAAVFGLVGVLPGLLIYGVSYQFVSRSIESWFDVRVEGALDSGPQPGTRPPWKPRHANSATSCAPLLPVWRKRQDAVVQPCRWSDRWPQLGATDATLWSAGNGRLIASAGSSRFELNPERPSTQAWRNVACRASSRRSRGWTKLWPGCGPARPDRG